MKVLGLVFASDRERQGGLCWTTPLEGAPLLARAVNTLAATPNVDEVLVATDAPDLTALPEGCEGAGLVRLPGWFFDFKLPAFSKEAWLITRALDALEEAGAGADVLVVHDWRAPLVTPRTLERMYHALLEDRVAARVAAVYPVDPNLFMIMPGVDGDGRFFPVWSDPGADRQMIPQLYRNLEIGAFFPRRLRMPIPETRGHLLGREEGVMARDAEGLELARFYLARRARRAQSAGATGKGA